MNGTSKLHSKTGLSRRPLRLENLEDRQLLTTLPLGFEETNYGSGLLFPTSMAFATPHHGHDRLLVTEKSGAVRLIEDGVLQEEPMLELTVAQRQEMGLESIAIDPDFDNNGYVYLYYTRLVSPAPINRLSRFQISATDEDKLDPSSETVLIDGIVGGDPGFHNGGFLHFGNDGMLYLGIGDTTESALVQGLENLQGKILRLDVANYPNIVPADNPYVNTPGARPEIWASGFRNPFTGAVDPESGRIYINDVGNVTWEEINELSRGGNYGWPLAEGDSTNPSFVNPVLAYAHDETIGASITGGVFYDGDEFPAEYHDDYFFGDYTLGFLKRYDVATGEVTEFSNDPNSPVDLDIGPDGQLYWLSLLNGSVQRISYVGGNRAPEAVSNADVTSGLSPLTVHFNSTGSFDPDGDAVTLLWDFGDGETSTAEDPAHTYSADGTYTVVLTVSDGIRSSTATPLTIVVGDTAPEITFTTPTDGQTYFAGQTLSFGATAQDRFGNPLPDTAFEWTVTFHHRQHTHPFLPSIPDVQSGTFTVPTGGETDAAQFYRVRVRVTNDSGISSSKFYDIQPLTSPVTLTTNYPGLKLLLDNQPITSPHPFVGVEQMVRSVEAPATQILNGSEYVFDGWSDGSDRKYTFITPTDDNLTYTANYTLIPNDASLTAVPPYQWYVEQEQTYNVTVTNLTNATWSATGPNAIRLAAYFGTSDETVGLDSATLIPLPRDILAGETIVIPVTIAAPNASGSFVLRHRMVADNGSLVRGATDDNVVVSGLAATYDVDIPTRWLPGETKTYSITITNTGTSSWPDSGSTLVHLGVYFGDERDEAYVWGVNEPVRYNIPHEVDVGESITLQISVTAPSAPGVYYLRHRMVRENVDWFIPQAKAQVEVGTVDVEFSGDVPTDWRGGEKKTYTVHLTNSGTIKWEASGVRRMRLGVYFSGNSDDIYDWNSEPVRFLLPHDVLPGESVDIPVTMTSPLLGGQYVLRHRMVIENNRWLEPLLKTTVDVDTLAGAITGTIPTNWRAGEAKKYTLTLTNTGTETWLIGGQHPVRLGVYFSGRSDAIGDWSSEPIRVFLPHDVAPGESVSVELKLTAPATPGDYVLRHRFVEEGVQWLTTLVKQAVRVDTLSATIEGTIPTEWLRGQTMVYPIVLTNTGTLTWTTSGPNPIRLGVNFVGSNGPIAEPKRFYLPHDILPGESVTINVRMTAPDDIGTYILRHRIVEERVQWLPTVHQANVQVRNIQAAAKILGTSDTYVPPSVVHTFRVRIVNRSKSTWLARGKDRVQLMYYFDNDMASALRMRLPDDLAPGEKVVLTLKVRMPATDGRYVLRFRMEHFGREKTRILDQRAFVVR